MPHMNNDTETIVTPYSHSQVPESFSANDILGISLFVTSVLRRVPRFPSVGQSSYL